MLPTISRALKVLAQYRATILTSTLLGSYAQLLHFELHRLASPIYGEIYCGWSPQLLKLTLQVVILSFVNQQGFVSLLYCCKRAPILKIVSTPHF